MSRDTWARDQIELFRAHERREARAERRRMKLLWWTPPPRHRRRASVLGSVTQLWSGRALDDRGGLFVAAYEAGDPVGAPPVVVLRVRPGDLPQARGRGIATAVGDPRPGGVLVLETRHGTVVPIEPPAEPDDDAPRWSEVDPDV